VKWGLVGRIVWAWVLTLPITITLGYLLFRAVVLFGWDKVGTVVTKTVSGN
jgi:PiT family inorganic phosphate transporter